MYPSGPNASQRQFHEAVLSHMWTAFFGGVRCGKTRAMCEQLFYFLDVTPGAKAFIFRKYEEDLDATVMRTWYEVLPPGKIQRMRQRRKECYLTNGSTITFKGLYTRNGRTQKIGSMDAAFIGIEEADEITQEDFGFIKARLSQAAIPAATRRGMLVANPPTTANWMYKQFIETPLPGHTAIRGKTQDNVENVGQEYIDDLKRTYPPAWIQRFLEGEFGFSIKGTPVIQGFDPSLHIQAKGVNPLLPLVRGWDFGFFRPATVFLQFDGTRWHWLDTLLGTNVHLRQWIPTCLQRSVELLPGAFTHALDACDHAGHQRRDNAEKTSVEILNDYGIYPVSQPTESIYRAIDAVQAAVTQGHLTVAPSNRLGIECLMGGWQLDQGQGQDGASDRWKPLREDIFIHCADALSYCFLNQASLEPQEASAPEGSLGWWGQAWKAAQALKELPGNGEFSTGELLRALR